MPSSTDRVRRHREHQRTAATLDVAALVRAASDERLCEALAALSTPNLIRVRAILSNGS